MSYLLSILKVEAKEEAFAPGEAHAHASRCASECLHPRSLRSRGAQVEPADWKCIEKRELPRYQQKVAHACFRVQSRCDAAASVPTSPMICASKQNMQRRRTDSQRRSPDYPGKVGA